MTDALLSGLLAGYGVAIPVGAIGVLIMGLAARTSLTVGAGAGLGVATADGLYALLAVAGGAAIAGLVRPVATPLRWIALAVLLGLAARTAWSAWRAHREAIAARPDRLALSTPGRAYAGLLGLTLLNPATMLYFSALVLGRQAAARSLPDGALFVAAAFAASASWQLLVAAGGSVLGRALAGRRGRLVTALVSSAVMVALAVRLAVLA
ncbi:MAG TPA: LysE family transporter [Rugosimonospora sp.]